MENFFSRLTLDIIGKAVFNYDFDSLTHDDPVIQVCPFSLPYTVSLHCHPAGQASQFCRGQSIQQRLPAHLLLGLTPLQTSSPVGTGLCMQVLVSDGLSVVCLA